MTAESSLYHLPVAPRPNNNCLSPSASASPCARTLIARRPATFDHSKIRVQLVDASISASGSTQLEVTLPFVDRDPIDCNVRLICRIGGLSAKIRDLIVSADMITATILVPDGVDLSAPSRVELTWVCASVLLPGLSFTIQDP